MLRCLTCRTCGVSVSVFGDTCAVLWESTSLMRVYYLPFARCWSALAPFILSCPRRPLPATLILTFPCSFLCSRHHASTACAGGWRMVEHTCAVVVGSRVRPAKDGGTCVAISEQQSAERNLVTAVGTLSLCAQGIRSHVMCTTYPGIYRYSTHMWQPLRDSQNVRP